MSKAPGRALSDYDWVQISRQTPGYPSLRQLLPLSDQQGEGYETVRSYHGAAIHNSFRRDWVAR